MDRDEINGLAGLFPAEKKEFWEIVFGRFREIKEIRLRRGMPVIIETGEGDLYVSRDGQRAADETDALVTGMGEPEEILHHICRYSPYAYEDEIRQGFLTAAGGHRIGLAGQVVRDEQGKVRTLKNIYSLNIRISHEIKGAADPLMPFLYENNGKGIKNTLIISRPGCGKTTILRDIIRQLSNGDGKHPGVTVGIVDERSEIAGTYMGIPQNDVGIRTDVLDACPKAVGIPMLVRSMAPKVVAVDEIGNGEDLKAVTEAMASGCSVLATMHGKDAESAFLKFGLCQEDVGKIFDLLVIMDRFGKKPGIAWIRDRGKKYVSSDGRSFDHYGHMGTGNASETKNVSKTGESSYSDPDPGVDKERGRLW